PAPSRAPSPPMNDVFEAHRARMDDGFELAAYRALPEGTPKGTLYVAHGVAEHARRYAPLAAAFAAAGWEVHTHDWRGHGGSTDADRPLGHLADRDSFGRAVADLRARLAEVRGEAPLVLLGHSGGSFHAQRLVSETPEAMDALVLSGSNGPPPPIAAAGRLVARIERARCGRRKGSPILQKLSFDDYNKAFAPNRTEFDWLSRDPAQVDLYANDPLCGFALSTQGWVDLLDALPGLTKPEALRRIPNALPVYVFSGDRDPVGQFGKGVLQLVERLRSAGIKDLTLDLYPEGRHEMLNETNAEEVRAKLLAWCQRVTA
ncbi:MAG: alpha/beta fold hydrolase, partial [Myxococcota bacterium]